LLERGVDIDQINTPELPPSLKSKYDMLKMRYLINSIYFLELGFWIEIKWNVEKQMDKLDEFLKLNNNQGIDFDIDVDSNHKVQLMVDFMMINILPSISSSLLKNLGLAHLHFLKSNVKPSSLEDMFNQPHQLGREMEGICYDVDEIKTNNESLSIQSEFYRQISTYNQNQKREGKISIPIVQNDWFDFFPDIFQSNSKDITKSSKTHRLLLFKVLTQTFHPFSKLFKGHENRNVDQTTNFNHYDKEVFYKQCQTPFNSKKSDQFMKTLQIEDEKEFIVQWSLNQFLKSWKVYLDRKELNDPQYPSVSQIYQKLANM